MDIGLLILLFLFTARTLIKEFAMYRYGVFEEQGYYNDPIYPMCYYDDQTKTAKVTGCSDLAIKDNGYVCLLILYKHVTKYNFTHLD